MNEKDRYYNQLMLMDGTMKPHANYGLIPPLGGVGRDCGQALRERLEDARLRRLMLEEAYYGGGSPAADRRYGASYVREGGTAGVGGTVESEAVIVPSNTGGASAPPAITTVEVGFSQDNLPRVQGLWICRFFTLVPEGGYLQSIANAIRLTGVLNGTQTVPQIVKQTGVLSIPSLLGGDLRKVETPGLGLPNTSTLKWRVEIPSALLDDQVYLQEEAISFVVETDANCGPIPAR